MEMSEMWCLSNGKKNMSGIDIQLKLPILFLFIVQSWIEFH